MSKKRFFIFLLTVLFTACLLGGGMAVSAEGYKPPEGTTVYADAAILVNLAGSPEQDVVLYNKGADEVHAPGSMMRYAVVAYALHRLDELGMDMDVATGTYTLDIAKSKVAKATAMARAENFPLSFDIEPE